MLIEINMGSPDFRVQRPLSFQPSVAVFRKVIEKLPPAANVGIGGEPLRLENWVEYLRTLDKFSDITIASSPRYLDASKLAYLAENDIFLMLEVNCREDLEFATTVLSAYPNLHYLCVTSGINFGLHKEAKEFGLDLMYENYIPLNHAELSAFVETLTRNGQSIATYTCGIINQEILGVNGDGTVFPCITMQFPEAVIGNLLTDTLEVVMRRLLRFSGSLTCPKCCQSRSFALYRVFDKDPLCQESS